jgi:chemotaxis response regulator CheB
MCVNVFLADDSEIMRKAIRRLLSDREDIAVVGEASNLLETIQKTAELHPDLITLGADEVHQELLQGLGAAKLLDKMDLSDQLIPAILELAESANVDRLVDAT